MRRTRDGIVLNPLVAGWYPREVSDETTTCGAPFTLDGTDPDGTANLDVAARMVASGPVFLDEDETPLLPTESMLASIQPFQKLASYPNGKTPKESAIIRDMAIRVITGAKAAHGRAQREVDLARSIAVLNSNVADIVDWLHNQGGRLPTSISRELQTSMAVTTRLSLQAVARPHVEVFRKLTAAMSESGAQPLLQLLRPPRFRYCSCCCAPRRSATSKPCRLSFVTATCRALAPFFSA